MENCDNRIDTAIDRYGETDVDYYSENLVLVRDFTPKMYFWPIDIGELRKDPNLVQNYGW